MEKITRFEKARAISARALQLSLGAPPLVKATSTSVTYDVAKQEFENLKLPFVVLRKYPGGEIKRLEIS
jgi:DNA-directed RNA polymerase subunit K/omega